MKTLYLECTMGAAGDMLMSALYELLPDRDRFLRTMNSLIVGVGVAAERAQTCGITGTRIEVSIDGIVEGSAEPSDDDLSVDSKAEESKHVHGHMHSSLDDIHSLISGLSIPEEVKRDASAVYDRLAEAESSAHGVTVAQIHFHEVGTLDAVIDIVGVCLAVHILAPDSVCVSPVAVGSGQIRCAHGLLPVPAPATAYLLRGLPCYAGEFQGELCTPTGAALLSYFGQSCSSMPLMTLYSIGYGVGKKEFPAPNCVRAFWGETAEKANAEIVELCCNIDDMTAEALAFAAERLMACGALDVSSSSITMKKGRVGIAFTVLCSVEDEERMAQAILRETSTNGVRARRCGKYILLPSVKTVETAFGSVKVKCADGFGIHHEKPEYESIAAISRDKGLPFQAVRDELMIQLEWSAEKTRL